VVAVPAQVVMARVAASEALVASASARRSSAVRVVGLGALPASPRLAVVRPVVSASAQQSSALRASAWARRASSQRAWELQAWVMPLLRLARLAA
jgi:hypothetical protein